MKTKKVKYTERQTGVILNTFKSCDSYEAQVLAAQNLANQELFSGWNTSHSAKEILAKVSSMSRPAVQPVLTYIKKPKPAPKPKILDGYELRRIIEDILGYNMFTGNKHNYRYTIARYVLADILKMLINNGFDAQGCFDSYQNYDLSEFGV